MYDELNEILNNSNDLEEEAKKVAINIFKKIKANSQEEINIKSSILKQAFFNAFELQFQKEFLDVSEQLLLK